MRRKKHKASRRVVRYFKLHFGFREPYKVLLDGNFLHAIVQLKYDNLEGIISTLLGGKVKLFVPSCVMRELRELAGESVEYKETVALARSFMRHKDCCSPDIPSSDSLIKILGDNNAQHWWLATLDKAVTSAVRKKGNLGVPIMYANLSGVHLMPPSEEENEAVAKKTQARMHVGMHELPQEEPESQEDEQNGAKKVTLKRKKRKGEANSLSVKPKSRIEKVTHDGPSKARRKR